MGVDYSANYGFGIRIERIIPEDLEEENKNLKHYMHTTVGLFATDKPELIPNELKDFFFELTYQDNI